MRFQYDLDENGNISDPRYVCPSIGTMEAEREIYLEGLVKEVKLSNDKKSFSVVVESVDKWYVRGD